VVNYSDAAIELQDVRVRRGAGDVVTGVTATVPRGQLVGLLGPSGSGKTTLMRAIMGTQAAVRGTVRVLGRPAGSPDLRHRIGYMAQGAAVYDDLTIRQNVRYFRTMLGAPAADIERVIAATDLTDFADRRVASLSGGQLSRVSLAIALLGTPELLVLDEPTVGLDPVLRTELWALFARLTEDGTCILVSTHVMDEAARCDRLLLMRDGDVIADGTPAGLLEQTSTPDIEAAFLAIVARGAEAR
jgi:ABC-2 type transport system ATP-binding protein